MSELLPCPLCPDGGKPYSSNDLDGIGLHVSIAGCNACGLTLREYGEGEANATWNRRAQPAPGAEALIQAALEMVDFIRADIEPKEMANEYLRREMNLRHAADAYRADIAAHSGKGEGK